MIRSSIFNILFYAFTFFVAATSWIICKLSTRKVLWVWMKFWGTSVVWMTRILLGARIEVRNYERYKQGQAQLFVSKHQSELDIVMLAYTMKDISAVAMEELTKLPFFGTILKKLDVVTIAVDSGPQGRTEQAIAGGKRMKAQGRSMVIYPEGELMKLGARERYRRGVYHMYSAMEVEAVPVAVSLGLIWPQRRWRKNLGMKGVMEFMEPIPPGLPIDDFMDEIEKRIEEGSMALLRENAPPDVLQDAERRFNLRLNNADEPSAPKDETTG